MIDEPKEGFTDDNAEEEEIDSMEMQSDDDITLDAWGTAKPKSAEYDDGEDAYRDDEAEPASAAAQGRRATATSRGVVYVESYDDEDDAPASGAQAAGRSATPAQIRKQRRLIILCAVCAVVLIAVIILSVTVNNLLSSNTVYGGVTLNGHSVAGMTREELYQYIQDRYVTPLADSSVTIEIASDQLHYETGRLLQPPDVQALTDKIYMTGRSGGLFTRVFSTLRLREAPQDYTLDYTVNTAVFDEILTLGVTHYNAARIEPSYVIEPTRIVFTCGRNGMEITAESLSETLSSFIASLSDDLEQGDSSTAEHTISITPQETPIHRIQKVNILNELRLESHDAVLRKTGNKLLEIDPEVVGIQLDEAALDAVLERVNAGNGGDGAETVTYELVNARIIFTKAFYESVLFRDTLGTASNRSGDDIAPLPDVMADLDARQHNMELAVAALNGYILMPGERGSFLEMLGTVSAETGYLPATEAYEGFDAPVLGGGIAQVASALYGALRASSMTVSVHRNYTYIPDFGLAGFDAYVNAAEQQDLAFYNDFTFPVRIEATYTNNTVTVSVMGTQYRETDFPDLESSDIPVTLEPVETVELSAQIIGRIPYETQITEDPDRPQGERTVTTPGIHGYTVELYLIRKNENGEETGRTRIGSVTYRARAEQVTVGTGA